MDKIISHNIIESCKKLGIPYHSCNPNYLEFSNDAQLLGQLYKDLIEIAGKLKEISERHHINGWDKLLRKDIKLILNTEHDLVKLAKKLKEKNE